MKRGIFLLLFALNFVVLAHADDSSIVVHDMVFSGSSVFEDLELRRFSQFRNGLPLQENTTAEIQKRIEAAYAEEGYPQARAFISQQQIDDLPLIDLKISIEEGVPIRIDDVSIGLTNKELPVPDDLRATVERTREEMKGRVASRPRIRRALRRLLVAVRAEGYLQARVHLDDVIENRERGTAQVIASIDPRQPISFIFEGNTALTREQLLEPLELKTREVPFGLDAVPMYVRNLEQRYQTEGYFNVRTFLSELPLEGTRHRFLIRIDEGEILRIGQVTIEGGIAFEQRELRKQITAEPAISPLERWWPGFVTSSQLDGDTQALEDFYIRRGYPHARVSYRLEPTDQEPYANLIYVIDEGSPRSIESIAIEGAPDEPSLATKLQGGDVFDLERIEDERLRFENELRNNGYPNAKVSAEEEGIATIVYSVQPGLRVRVSDVSIDGQLFTKERVIRRELLIQPGLPYDEHQVSESEQKLYRLGFFSQVDVAPSDGAFDSPEEALTVHVTERDTGSYGLGAILDSEDGLNLSAELNQRNVNGTGDSFLLSAEGFIKSNSNFFDAGRGRIGYRHPYLFDVPVTLSIEGYLQSSIKFLNDYSYTRVGSDLGLTRELSERLKLNLTISPMHEEIYDVPTDMIIGEHDSGNAYYTLVRAALTVDERDDTFNPRKGYRSRLEGLMSAEALGGDADFGGFAWQGAHYLPLGDRWSFGTAVLARFVAPFSSTEVVPLSQRIFLGGRNSLRGFSPNEVGPRGSNDNIVGGDTAVVLNLEGTYQLTDTLASVIFLDLGQTTLRHPGSFTGDRLSFTFDDLRYSPGLGIRYSTPIGPVSIEYGFALDREKGEGVGVLNFSVGAAF